MSTEIYYQLCICHPTAEGSPVICMKCGTAVQGVTMVGNANGIICRECFLDWHLGPIAEAAAAEIAKIQPTPNPTIEEIAKNPNRTKQEAERFFHECGYWPVPGYEVLLGDLRHTQTPAK